MTKWARNGCLNLLLLMTTTSTLPILETRLKKPFSSNRKVCFCLLKNVAEGHLGLHTVSFQLSRLLCTAYCGRASKGLFSYQLHGLLCTRALSEAVIIVESRAVSTACIRISKVVEFQTWTTKITPSKNILIEGNSILLL